MELTRHGEYTYWMAQGKNNPVIFEDLKPFAHYFYRVVEWDCPKKGEYYLSGAEVAAWRAPNDLSTFFWIVAPTFIAKRVQTWVKGSPIED